MSDRYILISADCHAGGNHEMYREYLEARYLDDFDRWRGAYANPFKDLTSGKQTYAAGRFLKAGLPKEGKVVLDFNKATNPPCAFTPYATCPLPPKQNYLPVAVEAGELNYEHAAGSNRHPANAGISHRRRSPATSD